MNLKKFAIFFGLFFILIGAGSALGWTLCNKAFFPAICVCVLVAAAVPTVKKMLKTLLDE